MIAHILRHQTGYILMNARLTQDEIITINAFNEVTAILKANVSLPMPSLPNEHKYYEHIIVNSEVNIEQVMQTVDAELNLISGELVKLKKFSNTLEFSELFAIIDQFSAQISQIQQLIATFLQVTQDLSPFDNQLVYQGFYHLLNTVRQASKNIPTIKYGPILMHVETKTLESFIINLNEIIPNEIIQLENQLVGFSNAINDGICSSLAQMIYSAPPYDSERSAILATLLNDPNRIQLHNYQNNLAGLVGIFTDIQTFTAMPEQALAVQKIKYFLLSKHVKEETKEKLRILMMKMIYQYSRNQVRCDVSRPLVLDANEINIFMPAKDHFLSISNHTVFKFSTICNNSKIINLHDVKMNAKNLLTFINILPEDINHLSFSGFALPDDEFATVINMLPEHITTITFHNLRSQVMHDNASELDLDFILKSFANFPKHIEVLNITYKLFLNAQLHADKFQAALMKIAANLPVNLKDVQMILQTPINITTDTAKQIYETVPNHVRFRLICKPLDSVTPFIPSLIPLVPKHIANHLLAGNIPAAYTQEQLTTLVDKLPDTDELDLSHRDCFIGSDIHQTDNRIEYVIASTKRRFHTLNLSHNKYCTDQYSITLRTILNTIPDHLEKLDLSNNNIGLYNMIAIPYFKDLFKRIPRLFLNLANNKLYLLGVKGLIELFANVTGEIKIDLRGNLLASHFTSSQLNEIFSSLPHADLSNFILERHTLAKLTTAAKQHFKALVVLLEENQEPDAAFMTKLKAYLKVHPDSILDELEALMRGEIKTKLEDITLLCAFVYEIIEETSQKNSAVFKRASFIVGDMIFRSEVDPSWSAEDKALYKNIKQNLGKELPTHERAVLEQQKQALAEQKRMFIEATLDKIREAKPYIKAADDYPCAADLLAHIEFSLANNNKGMYKRAHQQLLFPEGSQANNNDNNQDNNSRPRKIQKTSASSNQN